jgi:hypothetical protein
VTGVHLFNLINSFSGLQVMMSSSGNRELLCGKEWSHVVEGAANGFSLGPFLGCLTDLRQQLSPLLTFTPNALLGWRNGEQPWALWILNNLDFFICFISTCLNAFPS